MEESIGSVVIKISIPYFAVYVNLAFLLFHAIELLHFIVFFCLIVLFQIFQVIVAALLMDIIIRVIYLIHYVSQNNMEQVCFNM